MSDLISLVLGIPSIVEGFVKTCRAIESYRTVEHKHRAVIADAIHCSNKLNYYTHFVDISSLKDTNVSDAVEVASSGPDVARVEVGDRAAIMRDSQQILGELFQNSIVALTTARKIVDEWTMRLGLSEVNKIRPRHRIARIALTISDRLAKRISTSDQKQEEAILSNFLGKTAFLVIGSLQIEDAMDRLKYWLRELHDMLMVSPTLRYRLSDLGTDISKFGKDSHDDVMFVALARARERKSQTMETIKSELISTLRPLDDRKPHSFMLVDSKSSPYHGCLVDRRNVIHLLQDGNEEQAVKDTELIARLFAEERDELGHDISASVGVLPCCGFSRPIPEHHDLVFRLPENTRRPRTLRSLLLQRDPRHALNERLNFCIKLATAVLIVHSLGLVHKDIRPDSIIVLDQVSTLTDASDSLQTLGEPYLVAFNVSRSLDSATVPLTETQTEEVRWASLYTHPRHLTTSYHRPFEMRDDIYSLGICFLEIALWTSLFVWDKDSSIYICDYSVCDLSEERYDKMLEEMGEDVNRSQAWLRQHDLVLLAEHKVPVTMGNTFKDVVVECLTFGMGKKSLAEVIEERDLGRAHIQNQSIAFVRNVLSKLRGLKLT